jgi:hypothetical protein
VGQSGVMLLINCEQSPLPRFRCVDTTSFRRSTVSSVSSNSNQKG